MPRMIAPPDGWGGQLGMIRARFGMPEWRKFQSPTHSLSTIDNKMS